MTAFAPYKIIDTHCHVGLDHIGYSSVPYPGQENVVYCASCLNGKPESVIGYSSDVLPFFHTRLRDLSEFRVMLDTYGSRITGIGEIGFVETPYGEEIMPWIDVVLKVQERLGRRLPLLFHSGHIDQRALSEHAPNYNGRSEDYHDVTRLLEVLDGLPLTVVIAHAANPYTNRIPKIASCYNMETRILFDTTGGEEIEDRLLRLLVTSPWLYKYIVFGSDGDPHALERMKRKLSPLPLYVQEAIFYGNMARELRYV